MGGSSGASNIPKMSIETLLSTAANSLRCLPSCILRFSGSVGGIGLPLRWSVALVLTAYILRAIYKMA